MEGVKVIYYRAPGIALEAAEDMGWTTDEEDLELAEEQAVRWLRSEGYKVMGYGVLELYLAVKETIDA